MVRQKADGPRVREAVKEEERALGLVADGGDVEILVRPAAGDLSRLKVGLERGERHGARMA